MQAFDELIQSDRFLWEQLEPHLESITSPRSTEFLAQLKKLILTSSYALDQLVKYPELVTGLEKLDAFKLETEVLVESLADLTDHDQIKQQLRLFRHRKLLEIIYLDTGGYDDVESTLKHLSALADLIIQQALFKAEQTLSHKHGQPVDSQGNDMTLNIIGMGKLGGKELNFSSDIDLICCYAEDGQLKGFGQLSYNQYFNQVTKLFKQYLHETTTDGFVYRVDLRLRPWGDSGPIVLTHSAFEHYYQLHGREWEQYAMVKARVITGSETDKQHLESILTPFVYRRYHDYRVFDGLAQLKNKIDRQARSKRTRSNIKVGQGGIREIEFFVQAFQILKGGRNHQLQTPSIFRAFDTLLEQQITDQESVVQMRESYCFLRILENRIQMMNDQQTHDIPDNDNARKRIAVSLGYDAWEQVEQRLEYHSNQVKQIFNTLFHNPDQVQEQPSRQISPDEMAEEQHLEWIESLGFSDPDSIHKQLQAFYQSKALVFMSMNAKKRFHSFFPELLRLVCCYDEQASLLEKLLGLLSSIAGRSVYFELLNQNKPLLEKLVHIFDSSAWIASEVTQHPILLESMLYPEALEERFNPDQLRTSLSVQLKNIEGDEEMELDVLRQFKRAQTITIASASLAGEITTLQVSHYLSELAELILQAVYDLSLNQLTHQYGQPEFELDGDKQAAALGVIGYGKLGGYELHYQSDLDIIFLHNSKGSRQQTNGKRCIDNTTFFSRVAQKIISKISLLTAAGKLYEIDTRLRPDGASGMLVSSLSAYEYYQREKAWVWEHQAIIRARFIAGDERIKPEFDQVREQIIMLERDETELRKEVLSMRERIYQARNPSEGETINVKHSRGCIVDIEFLVQYWILKNANKVASLYESTDNNALITRLADLKLIDQEDLQLREIYQNYHKWLHTRVLQNQSADMPAAHVQNEINLVKACWNKTFNR